MVRAARARGLVALGLTLLVACSTAACAGTVPRDGRETAGAPLGDEALDDAARLATLLPSRAERCSVARPALIADRRRPLILHASQGDALAWSRDLRIVAYASARRTGERGRQEVVTLVRLAQPVRDRAALEEALPLRVRWEGEPCRADACDLPRAELVDARTLRIVRGDLDVTAEPVGGSPCVDLAIAWPSALELDASSPRCEDPQGERCVQRRVLEATSEGVRQRLEDSLGSEEAALRALESLRLVPDLEGGIDIDRRGATVVTVRRVSWTELELLLEDERIARAAYARREQERRARPVEEIDVERLPFVRTQVRLREERLERLHGEGRRRAADELADLLARALERHPDALDLARRLARLQLDELDDAAGAGRTADAAIATGVAPHDLWHALRREARVAELASVLASAGEAEPALARAAAELVEDGLAPDDAVARAAVLDLAALRVAGAPYELAESTWTHARALTGSRMPLRSAGAGGAPLASLPATLALLTELAGDPGPLSVFVVAQGRLAEGARTMVGGEAPEVARVLRLDHVARAPALAGSAASLDALLHLGAALEAGLAPGPLTLHVVLSSLSSPGVERTLRLEGELGLGRVRFHRVDAWSARHDWLAVERYLAEPLHAMGARVFPAPELVVRAASEEEAARLARAGDDPPQARCAAEGREIRCVPRSDSDARGSLRRIVRAALAVPEPDASEDALD